MGASPEVRWRLPGEACHLGAWWRLGGATPLGWRRQEIGAGPGSTALSLSRLFSKYPHPRPRVSPWTLRRQVGGWELGGISPPLLSS